MRLRTADLVMLAMITGLAACNPKPPATTVARGNAKAGKALLASYGCGSCHQIPGVNGADGLVGPPLNRFARRSFVAGQVPNNPEFLIRWIEVPQAIDPGTVMPNLSVSEGHARDIAAYLYTLR